MTIKELESIYDKVINGDYDKGKFVRLMDSILFNKWSNGYDDALEDISFSKDYEGKLRNGDNDE